jgi:hypothetical protein
MYDGLVREMCPHVIGLNKRGQPQALFYQFGGQSRSRPIMPDGSKDNWRCVEIAKLSRVERKCQSKHTLDRFNPQPLRLRRRLTRKFSGCKSSFHCPRAVYCRLARPPGQPRSLLIGDFRTNPNVFSWPLLVQICGRGLAGCCHPGGRAGSSPSLPTTFHGQERPHTRSLSCSRVPVIQEPRLIQKAD